jgi:nitrogen regulatory protein P-II 1
MKMIVVYLPTEQVDRVVEALVEARLHGLSVSDAKGFGQEHDSSHPDYKSFIGVDWTRKSRLELVCRDDEVDSLLDAVYHAAHRGRRGDGKVFVLPVDDVLRLKTGERGDAALGPTFGPATGGPPPAAQAT